MPPQLLLARAQAPIMQVWLAVLQALPSALQVPLSQQPPMAQVLFSQQGWPSPPQVEHMP